MIGTNLTLTSTELGYKLGIHQTTALESIKRLGFVPKLSVRFPHELGENFFFTSVTTCYRSWRPPQLASSNSNDTQQLSASF
ncbi:hypothetical protein TNCV_4409101 [Trichonephila clavipes]|nr:hypothetical protein TNCV_4409101 [Trichonephila clavipes]